MQTRSFLQRRTNSESRDRLTARIQTRPWSDPLYEQPEQNQSLHQGYDLSNIDLFSHDPGPRDYPKGGGRSLSPAVQAKLTVGAPNDQYEQEADRVADQVINMPDSALQNPVQREVAEEEDLQMKPLSATITPLVQRESVPEEEELQMKSQAIQRQEEEDELQMKSQAGQIQRQEDEDELQMKPLAGQIQQVEEEDELQMKPLAEQIQRVEDEEELQMKSSVPVAAPTTGLENHLSQSKSGGSPLPGNIRSFMEPRFGADFSQVRVHTGEESVQMNQDLNAQAFTHGQDIYFGAGKSPTNDALTAHELTHVVQQTGKVQARSQPTELKSNPYYLGAAPRVQRQLAGGAALLTPAQVGIARSWYAGHRSQYTPAIITQIQQAVGATATGRMDDATVQAIAGWQQSQGGTPPLAVDGIAGPRTLPALFAGGLARGGEMDQFVTAAKQVQTDWATLATAQARADTLMVAVNARLTAAGVPNCVGVLRNLGPAAGQLDFTTWQIDLGQVPFSAATITDDAAADITSTVYHEARHAEQWFRMAQMRAGQGQTAAQITTTMQIPATISAQAVANPLARGSMEALIAEGWYESVYGGRSAHRERVLTEVLSSKTALDNAQTAFDTSPTPAHQTRLTAARQRFDRAYQRYVDLPEEADAHRVGNAAEARHRLP